MTYNPDTMSFEVPNTDTVYISGMPPNITEEELAEYFGSIGVIKQDRKLRKPKIWLYRDKATGALKGDGTVSYQDPFSAGSAVQWFNNKDFKGSTLKVSLAERKQEGGFGGAYDRSGGYGGGGGGGGARGRGGGRGYDRGGGGGGFGGGGRGRGGGGGYDRGGGGGYERGGGGGGYERGGGGGYDRGGGGYDRGGDGGDRDRGGGGYDRSGGGSGGGYDVGSAGGGGYDDSYGRAPPPAYDKGFGRGEYETQAPPVGADPYAQPYSEQASQRPREDRPPPTASRPKITAAPQGPPGLFAPEDWACPSCGNMNWARRPQCNKCGSAKPGTADVRREGQAGGFKELDEVELEESRRRRKQADQDDGEMYDEFGRLKKKFRGENDRAAREAAALARLHGGWNSAPSAQPKEDAGSNEKNSRGEDRGHSRDKGRESDRSRDRIRESDRDRDRGREKESSRDKERDRRH